MGPEPPCPGDSGEIHRRACQACPVEQGNGPARIRMRHGPGRHEAPFTGQFNNDGGQFRCNDLTLAGEDGKREHPEHDRV